VLVPTNILTIQGNQFNGPGSSDPSSKGIVLNYATAENIGATVSGNSFANWAAAISLGSGTVAIVKDNSFCYNTTTIVSASGANRITTPSAAYAVISAAADNGYGAVRLTVDSTSLSVSGQWVLVNPALSGHALVLSTPIAVIDPTHMDLENVLTASGVVFTSGQYVTTLP